APSGREYPIELSEGIAPDCYRAHMAPNRNPNAAAIASVVYGRRSSDLSSASLMLSRTSLTASTASRPLATASRPLVWASDTTLRSWLRVAIAPIVSDWLCVSVSTGTEQKSSDRLSYKPIVPGAIAAHRAAMDRESRDPSFITLGSTGAGSP